MKTLCVILLLLGFALPPVRAADVRVFNALADLAAWVPSPSASNFVVRTFDSSRPFASQRPGHYDATSVAATNLGCVFATSTGVGRNLMDDCNGGEVDARWFGADATGTLPSSAAIQSATDYTMQTWGQTNKGVVVFPVGTFLIDATITNAADPLASRTIWRGQTKALIGQHTDEWHTVLKAAPNLNAPIVSFSNPRHVAITGIAFNGDRDNQSGFTGTGLVELVGGWGALESDLTDVAVFQSKTNGIYILRHVVQFERVHSIFNDYDGIRFNEYPGGDPTRTLGDCSLQNVQVGFNKGTGIRWNNCWVMRMYNVDVYYNNEDGMSITGGGQFRVYGLQSNNNGQNSLLIGGNTRDLVFVDSLFQDGNWFQFENYSDTGITEATNTAPSGTYHNVNIVGDGNNWETSFISCRFWSTPGGHTNKVGYLLYDGHPSPGQYITLIDPRLIDSTNHWDLGIANGAFLTNATMVGVRYGGTNAFTRFAEPLRRTRFSDDDFREAVLIERSDPSPHLRLNRPDTTAWATMDLGKGYFRQYANEGIFEFGNTNSATASGMTRINYLTLPNFWSTNANTLMFSGIGRTNPASGFGDNDLRIGGGSTSFDAFNRLIFYTTTNLTGSTGGVARLEIRPDGQIDLFPLASAPTNELANGQIYFNATDGLTQRRGGVWETVTTGGPYLPLAGGTMAGPVTSSSTWSGNSFTATGSSAALWTQVRSATTNSWAVFSASQPLTFYWLPAVGGGYATHYFDTNGSINSLQGTFFNTGNDGAGSTLDADLLDGQSSAAFQAANSNLTTVASLTGGASSNLFRGDGTFTNVVAGPITVDSIAYSATNLYEDLQFNISTLDPVGIATPPALVANSGRDSEALAAVFNANDVTIINIQMPHTWVGETTIYPHLHIEPQTANAITNTWRVKYSVASIGGTFPAWTVQTNTVVLAGGAQWGHKLMSLPTNGIPMTGFTGASVLVNLRLECISVSENTHVKSADVHYRVRGSPVAYTP